MTGRVLVLVAVVIGVLPGCEQNRVERNVGAYTLVLDDASGELAVEHSGRELVRLKALQGLSFTPEVDMLFAHFTFERQGLQARNYAISGLGTEVRVDGGASLEPSVDTNGSLRLRVRVPDSHYGMKLAFHCANGARFWGFGEQYNFVDLRGQNVPIWVEEQGVGREEEPALPFIGTLVESYFPMPYFLDPAKGYGFLTTANAYSEFDLCAAAQKSWTLEIWQSEAELVLFPGPEPLDVVDQLSAEVGRPSARPPQWAFDGVWLAAQGGSTQVRERVEKALSAEIPLRAVWVQDWVGLRDFGGTGENFGVKYRWNWDPELYPDLPTMIAEFDASGVRFLGYFNPFIVPKFDQWETAVANGYTIEDPTGTPYLFQIITFDGSLLDVTDPDAAAWFRSFARRAVELGMAGWMSDFGEWLPFDAQIERGSPTTQHNLYPTQWHQLSREVLEDERGDDWVMFSRSGFTGEHRVAQIVWAGDQEADWSETDGMPTVVTAGLTLGMAGIPFFTHDIAGFSGGPSTKELFLRWTELGAFSPIMRTHDGLKKLENWRFDSDGETLAHFRRMGKIHEAMWPVWKRLVDEAMATGRPMLRHTAFVDPGYSTALEAHHQWMLGADWLFVPVVHEGATKVDVVFPDGNWTHVWTNTNYSGRQVVAVDAPIGRPAVFVRSGVDAKIVSTLRGLDS